jgi:hypothetical protein
VRSSTHQDREHLVIMAHYPPLPSATCDAIGALVKPLHPQAVLSFTEQDGPGLANVQAASHPAEVAGAVADIKRRGGWDDSPAFRVVVGDRSFLVTLQWKDHTSTAVVIEQAG